MKEMKLMILDDSQQFCNSLLVFMREFDFVDQITITNDFNEFKAKYLVEQPDIVLLDIQMPDISGFDVLKAIKMHKPSQSVIMVSMYNDPLYMDYSKKNGATAYIPKTDVANNLGRIINEVLEGKAFFKN